MLKIAPSVEAVAGHHTFCSSDWAWNNPRTQVNELLLWIIVKGRGTLTTERGVFPLRAGDCFLMPLRETLQGRHDPLQPLEVPWMILRFRDERGRIIPRTPETTRGGPAFHRRLDDVTFATQLCDRSIDAFLAKRQDEANRWLASVLLEIERQDRQPRFPGAEREQHERIHDLCECIRAIPARPWRVEDLARELHYSSDHFSRIFRAVTGMTPKDFIIQARINAAKSLLMFSSHSISRIADTLGYGDVYHFSRQFKEKTGINPTAYRRG